MKQAITTLKLALVSAIALGMTLTTAPTAQADAKNGNCAKGYKLHKKVERVTVKNNFGNKMYTIKLTHTWCGSAKKRRIASTHTKQSVTIHDPFGSLITDKGTDDKEARFISDDSGHPRYAQTIMRNRKLRVCLTGPLNAVCFEHHYEQYITAYADGNAYSSTVKIG